MLFLFKALLLLTSDLITFFYDAHERLSGFIMIYCFVDLVFDKPFFLLLENTSHFLSLMHLQHIKDKRMYAMDIVGLTNRYGKHTFKNQ